MSRRLLILCGLAALLSGTLAAPAISAQVAVVVNRSNPIDGVNLEELRGIYLGRTTTFAGQLHVILVEDPRTRSLFNLLVLQMDEGRVKRHWIGLVFSGDGAIPPRAIEGPELLKQFIVTHPGAIGFLDRQWVDGSIKVLRVEGKLPGDADYLLRAPKPAAY